MPVNGDGYGYGPETMRKQELFRRLLRAHMHPTWAVIDRNGEWAQPTYFFIDLTAGPGIFEGEQGSPMIFAEEAVAMQRPFWGWFVERNRRQAAELRLTFDLEGPPVSERTQVFDCDNRIAVQEIIGHLRALDGEPFGLIYADPNGELPIAAIRALTAEFRRLDVLVHASATTYKRVGTVHHRPRLLESLDEVGKQYCYLAEPRHRFQWTFVLLTNWSEYKGIKEIGFYSERTDRGASVREKLSLTAKELRERGQSTLW